MLCARYTLDGTKTNTGEISTKDTWVTEPEFKSGNIYRNSMSSGSMKWDAETTAKILNNNGFTWMGWVYVDPNESNAKGLLFGNNGFGSNDNRKFSIFQHPTQNDIYWSWMNDMGAVTFSTGTLEGVLKSYEWTHVAFVFDGSSLKIYINGSMEYIHANIKSNSATFKYSTQVFHDIKGRRLQDVRIYNEAVAEDLIEDVAHGLSQHYKLNTKTTTSSLMALSNKSFTVNTTDHYVHYGNTTGGYYNNLVVGETYIYDITCTSANNYVTACHGADLGDTNNRAWTAWLYMQNTNYTTSNYSGYIEALNFTTANYNHVQIGNRHLWIFKATYKCCAVRINGYKIAENYELNFSSIRLYKASDLSLLMDSNLSTTTDTPRYDKSMKLSSSGTFIGSFPINRTNSLGLSFWIKFNDLTNDFYFLKSSNSDAYTESTKTIYTKDSSGALTYDKTIVSKIKATDTLKQEYKEGEDVEITSTSTSEIVYKGFAKTGLSFRFNKGIITLGIDDVELPVKTITDSFWHNFVVSSDGERNVKVYCDGKLVSTGKPKSSSKIARAESHEPLSIFGPVMVSDVRMYGRPLTETESLGLYGITPTDYKVTN